MEIYASYYHFIDSTLIDQFVSKLIYNSWQAFFLITFIDRSFLSLPLIFIVLFRPYIKYVYPRKLLTWSAIIWCFVSNLWVWMSFLIFIEFFRELIKYVLPYCLRKIGSTIGHQSDPAAETLFRRMSRVLRKFKYQPLLLTLQEISSTIYSYNQNDITESFSSDEQLKFNKFFQDFVQTCIIVDKDTSNNFEAITLFFPSFAMRFSYHGFQLTTDEAAKLIRGKDIPLEDCPICKCSFSDPSVQLKCNHYFCMKCIFSWLDQQCTCPVCRNVVE